MGMQHGVDIDMIDEVVLRLRLIRELRLCYFAGFKF